MKTKLILLGILALIVASICYFMLSNNSDEEYTLVELREMYSSGDQSNWPAPNIDEEVLPDYVEIGVLGDIEHPESNPFSDEKAELGKHLFFDARLSESKQISCASCHEPQIGWSDAKRVANGDFRAQGNRNTPTIINIGFAKSLFWDGRANSLEEQIHGPIENPLEMNSKFANVVKNIETEKEYDSLFVDAFGDKKVTVDRVTKAIATYQRTIKSTRSRFDLFIEGKEDEFTDEELLGLHLFRTKARCVNCHHSPYFSDQKFHNLGLTYYGRYYEDLGLYKQTGKKEDVGRFKTPTLREVGKTGPYMHNGLFPFLDGIMNMYNVGMPRPKRKEHQLNDTLFPQTSHLLKKLELTEDEKKAVEKFLHTLSSRTAGIEIFLEE